MPVTDTSGTSRNRVYGLGDGFLRFWFRFVFPFQADLEAGLAPATVFESEIKPDLADHLSPAIEELVRDWVRRTSMEGATRVGSWWGPALDAFRATNERTTEDIDVVGIARRRVVLIGEVRWRNRPMDVGILREIERYKLPALRRAARVVAKPGILLVSREGFTAALRDAADRDNRIRLLELSELVAGA
jgi:hypothetical protein